MSARLVGVGVGPGDPELLTVKAVRVLRTADVVLVPVLDIDADATGRAEGCVRAHLGADPRVRRVRFALNDRRGLSADRVDSWDAAARAVLDCWAAGAATVAFATIGDPSVYSTFSYLAQTVRAAQPDVVVDVVPGITAMQDLAARSRTPLCQGTETLALLPMTAGLDRFAAALDGFDTVVAYKGGRRLPQMLDAVKRAGRLHTAVHGAALGLPGEDVRTGADVAARREEAPYLSTLLVPPARRGRGERL
ncbi:MAG: precorrin-2 C(20)-methyltransferase [Actinomycetota bacterium]|nr:precorrin-2 C(20)-methyltransferase [Actinomycetota bacterium]